MSDTLNKDVSMLLLKKIVLSNDEKAFEQLFQLFYSPLCIFAKRYIERIDIREDIVQDVFIYLWENKQKISIDIDLRNYLMASVKNGCLNYLRQEKVVQRFQEKIIEDYKINYHETEHIYMLSELKEQLSNALSRLPEKHRKVFEKNKKEGLNYEEIAKELSISIRTAKRYNYHATEKLKTILKNTFYLGIIIFKTLLS